MLISSVDPGFGLPRLRQKLNDDNLNIETIGLLENILFYLRDHSAS